MDTFGKNLGKFWGKNSMKQAGYSDLRRLMQTHADSTQTQQHRLTQT